MWNSGVEIDNVETDEFIPSESLGKDPSHKTMLCGPELEMNI